MKTYLNLVYYQFYYLKITFCDKIAYLILKIAVVNLMGNHKFYIE